MGAFVGACLIAGAILWVGGDLIVVLREIRDAIRNYTYNRAKRSQKVSGEKSG